MQSQDRGEHTATRRGKGGVKPEGGRGSFKLAHSRPGGRRGVAGSSAKLRNLVQAGTANAKNASASSAAGISPEGADPAGKNLDQAFPIEADCTIDIVQAELDRIAEAAVLGDQESLQKLWNSNRRWVAAILLAHKPKWADVEDLLQEVAYSMVRKLGEVRDPRAVRPWLRTVAVNVAHAAARSGKRRAADERMGENSDDIREGRTRDHVAAPDMLSDDEQGRLLMDLASQLPDGYREPLLLKALHNLSYREIGEIMDLPETTIETRIARGRKQLRELAAGSRAFAGADAA